MSYFLVGLQCGCIHFSSFQHLYNHEIIFADDGKLVDATGQAFIFDHYSNHSANQERYETICSVRCLNYWSSYLLIAI